MEQLESAGDDSRVIFRRNGILRVLEAMRAQLHSRIDLRFDYLRRRATGDELVAIGRNRIACMRRDGATSIPTRIPDELHAAILEYG